MCACCPASSATIASASALATGIATDTAAANAAAAVIGNSASTGANCILFAFCCGKLDTGSRTGACNAIASRHQQRSSRPHAL